MRKKSPSKRKPKHRYDWRPDLPDQRDYLFSQKVAAPPALPNSVDLRPNCPPIVNQGQIGSCTGNALAGALGFLELKELKEKTSSPKPEVFTRMSFAAFSRLFIYYNERAAEGHEDQDAGASLRDGIKTLTEFGGCRESTWKYSAAQVLKKPSAKAYAEAAAHKITTYLRLQTLADMQGCLAAGYPFVFGFTVYESFETPEVAKTGIMPIPNPNEQILGGHAVMAVGYDDARGFLIVRNSWGAEWGQKGYFFMPYEYLTKLRQGQDFWTVRR